MVCTVTGTVCTVTGTVCTVTGTVSTVTGTVSTVTGTVSTVTGVYCMTGETKFNTFKFFVCFGQKKLSTLFYHLLCFTC